MLLQPTPPPTHTSGWWACPLLCWLLILIYRFPKSLHNLYFLIEGVKENNKLCFALLCFAFVLFCFVFKQLVLEC